MKLERGALLAQYTTFRIGGPASLYITLDSAEELPQAYELAQQQNLPIYPLGQGSNILAADGEIKKAVVSLQTQAITYEEVEGETRVVVDAGVSWDALVEETTKRDLWGLENLAGIPGTVGAAPVQNIGAYGSEVADTLMWVEAYDPAAKAFVRLSKDECAFGYRDSRFKRVPGLFITRVAFSLSRKPQPRLSYPDLRARMEGGAELTTPTAIAQEVRAIRAQKFPDLSVHGTAGSFFKNPTITEEAYAELRTRYPELPGYAGEKGIKIPLAWILDHVLALKGFAHGPVSLFERQPLVLVADRGATAHDVHELAAIVTERVFDATKISIEREAQSLA